MAMALGDWEWAPVHFALVGAIAAVAIPFALVEWLLKAKGDFVIVHAPVWIAYPACAALVILTLGMSSHYQANFIYFQF